MLLFGKQNQAVQRPSAIELFTDREEERAVIARHLDGLQRILADSRLPPVLQFYGIGGIGKSTLLRKAAQESSGREHFSFVSFDVDHSGVTNLPATELFWGLRRSLYAVGIPTPLFDCLFLVYRAKTRPGEKVIVTDLLQDLTASTTDASDRAQGVLGLFDYLKEFGALAQEVSSKVQMVSKVAQFFKTRLAKAKIGNLGIDLAVMEVAELDSLACQLLAKDILTHLEDYPYQSLCIAVDGYERIQINRPEDKLEYYFQQFCAVLAETSNWSYEAHPRVKFLIFGRNKLRWDEAFAGDPDGIGFDWADRTLRRIEWHSLGGLSEGDARYFLIEKAARQFSERGMADVAQTIERHTAEILAAALEQPDRFGEPCYYPYYLDLAVDMILKQGDRFSPGMLGKSPLELQQRFLKYLGDAERKAIQTLAMALQFDKPLFQYLAAGSYLGPSYSAQDFGRVAYGNHAYLQELADGRYAFHRHMQQALVDSMNTNDGDRAAASDTIDAICRYYQQAVDAAPSSEEGIEAARRIADIVLTHGESGLIPLDFVARWLSGADSPNFEDMTDAPARLARYERFLNLFSGRYDTDGAPAATPSEAESDLLHEISLVAGTLFFCNGDPVVEKRFCDLLSSLFDGRPFNKQMPAYLSVANTMASMYFRRGLLDEALACLVEVQPLLDECLSDPERAGVHLATGVIPILMSISNIAARAGDLDAAIKPVAGLWDAIKGALDFDLAPVVGLRLRQLYVDAGKQDELAVLEADLAPHLERAHVPQAAIRTQMLQAEAKSAEQRGDFIEARRLYLELTEALRQMMGARATTLISPLVALGRVESQSGDAVQGCATQEQAVALAEESHVGGLTLAEALHALACSLLQRGDPEGVARAEHLLRQSIPIIEAHHGEQSAEAGLHRLQLARTLARLGRGDESIEAWLAAAECYRAAGRKYVVSYAISVCEVVAPAFQHPAYHERIDQLLEDLIGNWNDAIVAENALQACRLWLAYGTAMIRQHRCDDATRWLHHALWYAQTLAPSLALSGMRSDALQLLGVDQEFRGMPLAALNLFQICMDYMAENGLPPLVVAGYVERLSAVRDQLEADEQNGPPWMRPSRWIVVARALAALGGKHDMALAAFSCAVEAALAGGGLIDAATLSGEAFNYVAGANVLFEQGVFDEYFRLLFQVASAIRDQLESEHPLVAANAYFRVARHQQSSGWFEDADGWLEAAERLLASLAASGNPDLPEDELASTQALVLHQRALNLMAWGRNDEAKRCAEAALACCDRRRTDMTEGLRPLLTELIAMFGAA